MICDPADGFSRLLWRSKIVPVISHCVANNRPQNADLTFHRRPDY
jgi:hypothetical protein